MVEKKIQKPVTDEFYVRPQGAWKMMKAAQSLHQMVYIYGVSGSGKTSFVEDFLSEAGMEKVTVLSEDQEELPQIIVLDDLHSLESTEDRSICGRLIEQLAKRKDLWVILISRAQIPKWLKTVYVQCTMLTIGEEELYLSESEQELYFNKWEICLTNAAAERLRRLGYGHPLYLRIAAMRLKAIPKLDKESDRAEEELRAIEVSREDFWDYLEIHVYDQWNLEQQEFLEMLSTVEVFDLQMAQQITKKEKYQELQKIIDDPYTEFAKRNALNASKKIAILSIPIRMKSKKLCYLMGWGVARFKANFSEIYYTMRASVAQGALRVK